MSDTKRKMLTPQERVAKAQAELAEAVAKAEAKDRARYAVLTEKHEATKAKAEVLTALLDEYRGELRAIEERVPSITDVAQPTLAIVTDEAPATGTDG